MEFLLALAFRPLVSSDPVLLLGLAAFFLLLVAMPIAFWAIGGKQSSSAVTVFIAASNFVLTAQLISRWWQSGHFPVSNLYESLCFLAWACTLTQLLAERTWPSPYVGAAATPMALISVGFANFVLPQSLQSASPLVPALRSSWLVMHVSVIMCSYAALLVGSLFSLAVIFLDKGNQLQIRSSSLGVGGFRSSEMITKMNGTVDNSLKLSSINLGLNEQLDSLSYRVITVGFLLLTIGLISGSVWANEAWGTWWSWDPKETWALICWFFYAAYLHTRLTRGWTGRKPAIVAVAGIFVIILCYIGVNLLGIGLHSYGWFFE